MSLAVGPITVDFVSDKEIKAHSPAATGGVGPYTYQWYKSVITGFTPGPSNAIAGATALTLDDQAPDVIPGTQYYLKLRVTDTGNSNATADSAEASVLTSQPTLDQNQFTLAPFLGTLDLRFNPDTLSVEYDPASNAGPIFAGQAVKFSQAQGPANGIPRVVPITATTDEVAGFVNYDIKSQQFNPGDKMEISMDQNVMYLYATAAIARGAQVGAVLSTVGGVGVPASGDNIVGFALDVGVSGQLMRVKLQTPSFKFA